MNIKRINDKHVLLVVENSFVPLDSRVWNEAKSIRKICDNVTVLCHKDKRGSKYHKIIDDIDIYMYPNIIDGSGIYGLITEYIFAYLFISIYSLLIYIIKPFQVVHLANPPDFLSIIYFPFKLLNVKIIFDNHDLSPETYIAKFGRKDMFYKALLLLEKITYKLSDRIITVNESFKTIISKRKRKDKKLVIVVRNGPNLNVVKKSMKKRKNNIKENIIGYVGKIEKQDNLEKLVLSIEYIVKVKKYKNFKMLIIGDGTNKSHIEELVKQKGLSKFCIFHGPEYDRIKLYQLLASTKICVDPQIYSEESKIITAIKIMEYMAVGKPVIQYNNCEGRVTAGESSLYIPNNNEKVFGDVLVDLLKDKERRLKMGKNGLKRFRDLLQWEIQEKKLLCLYSEIFS